MLRFIILVIVAIIVMAIARKILIRMGIITPYTDRINRGGKKKDGVKKDEENIDDAKFEEIK